MEQTLQLKTRVEAKLHGETIGWFDTAEEAEAALDAAMAEEEEN